MKKIVTLIILSLILSGCTRNKFPKLNEVLSDEYQFTGIAVSKKGRVFLNYPVWADKHKYHVVEAKKKGKGKKVPYPDEKWNSNQGILIDRFVNVQSLYADENDFLWVLDNANQKFQGVLDGGAKLIVVDLNSNTIYKKYFFNEPIITKNSYLNDIRIDVKKKRAYITDSGEGGIIVLDIDSGIKWKVLGDHPSAKAEPDYIIKVNNKELRDEKGQIPQIHSDGIALDSANENIYYHSLTGKNLYKIKQPKLESASVGSVNLGNEVENVLATGAADGLISDKAGNVFITSIEKNSIEYINSKGKLKTLVTSDKIAWPDSFSLGPDDSLYFTTSRIHEMPWFNSGKDIRKEKYKVYKVSLKSLYPFSLKEFWNKVMSIF